VSERLPTHLEVSGILRRTEASGDFATVIRKGEAERGSLLILVGSRGRHLVCLERILSIDGNYRWVEAGPGESASSADVRDFVSRRARFDEDLWAIELDIADPERFIAETTASP
jgi:hypothetical protein